MSGTLCMYRGCSHSRKKNPELHFFTINNHNDKRHYNWLLNCESPRLEKDPLCPLIVCECHFEDKCFMNARIRKTLTKFAVPTLDAPPREYPHLQPSPSKPEPPRILKYYSAGLIIENGFGCPTLLLDSYHEGNSNEAPLSVGGNGELPLPGSQISGTTIRDHFDRLPNTLDENEQYSEFIASELRRLPHEKISRVKTKIQELLNEELIHN